MTARADRTAVVERREELSPTCFGLDLAVEGGLECDPGQFGMLSCTPGFDPLLRRAFSLAGVEARPGGTTVRLLVKEVGKGTALLRRLPVGTTLRLLAPLGNGFTLEAAAGERLALVAGGIGLPPVLFAGERLAARGVAFDLYFGAATAAELIELERCRAVVAGHGELCLASDDGSAGTHGFVTELLARRVRGGAVYRRVLACGPDAMLRALGRIADPLGLEVELSLEEPMACGVGVCLGCVVELADGAVVPSCREGPVFPLARLAARWRQ